MLYFKTLYSRQEDFEQYKKEKKSTKIHLMSKLSPSLNLRMTMCLTLKPVTLHH